MPKKTGKPAMPSRPHPGGRLSKVAMDNGVHNSSILQV